MTHTASPSSLELEHVYRVAPDQVFDAWADPQALMRWGAPGNDWRTDLLAFSFEVGGEQVTEFGPPGGPVFVNRMRYYDIVPAVRIVMAGGMTRGTETLFVGVLTVEFAPAGGGCRLSLTEQGMFLDGHDLPENHRVGWQDMLRRLDLDCSPQPATTPEARSCNSTIRKAFRRAKPAPSPVTSAPLSTSSSSTLAVESKLPRLSGD